MVKKKEAVLLSVFLLWGMLILLSSKFQQKKVFKLAEVHDEQYPTSIANQKFADLVKEKTEGRIEIEIYTDGVLGEETEVIQQMQKGNIAFGRISISPLAEYVDQLHALMLPYLYKDSSHMWNVLNSNIGDEMLDALSGAGLTGLAWYDSGARSFYLNERVTAEDGFYNKRIRVQKNSLMYALCEALGAKPQAMPENEVYLAVLGGSLDGAENNIPTYESYRQEEVCQYYILDEHTRIPDILACSKKVMEKLSKEDQEAIKEAAAEAGEYERVLWKEREQEAIVRLQNKGVQFITLSDETKVKLKEACKSLYEEFGGSYQEIIRQIEEMDTTE